MILDALIRYYDHLSNDPKNELPSFGWSYIRPDYLLDINIDGTINYSISLSEQASKRYLVPDRYPPRTSGIEPYLLADGPKYILGLQNNKLKEGHFESSRDLHLKVMDGISTEPALAIKNYYSNWQPNAGLTFEEPSINISEMSQSKSILFTYRNVPLQEDRAIQQAILHWFKYGREAETRISLVSGEQTRISETHHRISKLAGGKQSGALISFNAPSAESWNRQKAQGNNAPVGIVEDFKYTNALNHLLNSENQRIVLGDTTMVYWTDSSDEGYIDIFNQNVNPKTLKHEEKTEESDNFYNLDELGSDDNSDLEFGNNFKLTAIMQHLSFGKAHHELDINEPFYILSLSPNNGRNYIRFFYKDTFGNLLHNLNNHNRRLRINNNFRDYRQITPRRLMYAILTPAERNKLDKRKPISFYDRTFRSLMKSIIFDMPYPQTIYFRALERIRSEIPEAKDLSQAAGSIFTRVSILKAFLLKNYELSETEVPMGLDKNNNHIGYLLGRLFAVLERIQEKANESTNIRSRYIDAASSTPLIAFPELLAKGYHHLDKIEKSSPGLAHWLNRKIDEIQSKFDDFPRRLPLEEQGLFFIGYSNQHYEGFKRGNDQTHDEEDLDGADS